ncbi:uncharacterized protein [Eleutherodactylus coqui]|uniref:uncharacterized protein n=1 Tax=Eleutherodactylus coqui TaxID=57060 RepID=UPI0034619BEF
MAARAFSRRSPPQGPTPGGYTDIPPSQGYGRQLSRHQVAATAFPRGAAACSRDSYGALSNPPPQQQHDGARSTSQRFCYVNPRFVEALSSGGGESSYSYVSRASKNRQGQGAKRRQRERARRERYQRRRDSEQARLAAEASGIRARAGRETVGEGFRGPEQRHQTGTYRQADILPETQNTRDCIRHRRRDVTQERPELGHLGTTQETRARRAPHVNSRQSAALGGRSPGGSPARSTPLATPEDRHADGAFQGAASTGGRRGRTLPAFLVEAGRAELLKLVETSVAAGTWKQYNAVWQKWVNCAGGRMVQGERARAVTLDMLAALRKSKASVDVVKKHLAGVAFLLKLHSLVDVTKEFVFRQIVRGWKKEKAQVDTRRPITYPVLCRLLEVLEGICTDSAEALLFRSAFLLAFFAALRIGELVPASRFKAGGLHDNDVMIVEGALRVRIRKSKTDVYGRGEWVSISPLGARWCPVATVTRYMAARPPGDRFLVHASGFPLTRFQVAAVLRRSLRAAGFDASDFGTHSFRIGAATSADAGGMSEEGLKRLGRWKSQAYKSYVRPDLMVGNVHG